jgi:mannose-1-phosphate guanylyltransferase
VCAAERHRSVVLDALVSVPGEQFMGEPEGRDTLAAIDVSAAVIRRRDPDAMMAVLRPTI